jgi:hypothetical protein
MLSWISGTCIMRIYCFVYGFDYCFKDVFNC